MLRDRERTKMCLTRASYRFISTFWVFSVYLYMLCGIERCMPLHNVYIYTIKMLMASGVRDSHAASVLHWRCIRNCEWWWFREAGERKKKKKKKQPDVQNASKQKLIENHHMKSNRTLMEPDGSKANTCCSSKQTIESMQCVCVAFIGMFLLDSKMKEEMQ